MNRTAAYILGPELVWVLMLALAGIIVALNQPVTGLGHLKLIFINWYLPTIGVLLAFVPLFWAPGNAWWWLLRIGLASLIGIVLLVGYLCKSASYGDIRNIGVGMGFAAFVGLGWTVLFFVGLTAVLCVASNWSFLPVLTWMIIGFSAFLLFLLVWWRTH